MAAEPILIIVDANATSAQSEFAKVNSSMSFLAESAERAGRTANQAFTQLFQSATKSARDELQEMANIYQQRVQLAYNEARQTIQLIEQKKRALTTSLEAEVKALSAAQDQKIRRVVDAINAEKAMLEQRKQAIREAYSADVKMAQVASSQKLAQAKAEFDAVLAARKAAEAAGRPSYSSPTTGKFVSFNNKESEALYAQQKKLIADDLSATIAAARAKQDAQIKAQVETFGKFSKSASDQKNLINQSTQDAIKAARDKASVQQKGLDEELAATRRNFRDKKAEADKDFRDSTSRLKQAQDSALSFGRIFGANFFADLAARAVVGLLTALRDYVKESVLYAARTEELGIALHAVAKANNVSTVSVDAQEASIKRLNITTQDTRQVLARFVAAQFDVTKANKLAVVAQDLAVIAGRTTAEEFEKLNDAIQTLQTRNLRTAGVYITVDQVLDTLAKTTGRARNSFSTLEKQTAVLNAVLEYGARVTGTYDAAMTAAAKQMRSTERFILELQNSFGSLFTGILYGIVIVLNPLLEFLGKNRLVFIGLIITVLAFTAAIVSAGTGIAVMAAKTIPSLAGITTAVKLAASAWWDYAAAVEGAGVASAAASRVSGIIAIVALLASLIYTFYSLAKAQDELKGANERLVDNLLITQKQIQADIVFFQQQRNELGENNDLYEKSVAIQDRFGASLQLLDPVEQARIQTLGTMREKIDALNIALSEQDKIIKGQLHAEREAAAGAIIKQLAEQNSKYIEVSQAIKGYGAAQANVIKAEKEMAAARAAFDAGTDSGVKGQTTSDRVRDAIDNLIIAKNAFKELKNTIIEGGDAYLKAQEDVRKFTAPLAQMAVQQEELAGRTVDTNEQAGILSKTIVGQIDVLMGNADAQAVVATQVQILIQRMIEEKNKFKDASGAIQEMVEALNNLKLAQLDIDKTPLGAFELARDTSQRITDLRAAIAKDVPSKEAGAGGEGAATFIAKRLGITKEDLQANAELQDRFIASLNETRLRAVQESAKSIEAVLGPDKYKEFLESDSGKLINQLSGIAAEGLKIQAKITNPFDGISKSGKVAATEVEKLSKQIKRVEDETAILAKGGDTDATDKARLRRAETLRDAVRDIYQTRFELGVDAGKAIPQDFDQLAGLKEFYDRLNSIRELRRELRLPVKVALPTSDTEARDEIDRLERVKSVRDDVINLMRAEADARQKLITLQISQEIPAVDASIRAQTKYLTMLQERRDAEQELTADLAVEIRRRADLEKDITLESQRIAAEVFKDRLQEERESTAQAIKAIYELALIGGSRSGAFAGNPIIERALDEARKLSTQKNPIVGQLTTTNKILQEEIAKRLDVIIGKDFTKSTDTAGLSASKKDEVTAFIDKDPILQKQIEDGRKMIADNQRREETINAYEEWLRRGHKALPTTKTIPSDTDSFIANISLAQKGGEFRIDSLGVTAEQFADFLADLYVLTGKSISSLDVATGEGKEELKAAVEVLRQREQAKIEETMEFNRQQDLKINPIEYAGTRAIEALLGRRIGADETRDQAIAKLSPDQAKASGVFSAGLGATQTSNEAERLRQQIDSNKEIQVVLDAQLRTTIELAYQRTLIERRTNVEVRQQAELQNITRERALLSAQAAGTDAGRLARLEVLQNQQIEREKHLLDLDKQLLQLHEDQATRYLESAKFREEVTKESEVRIGSQREATARRAIELEYEIAHAAEGAADRYRVAWLEAILDIQTRDEEAVKRQIKAQVELADGMNIHIEQVRADVLEFLNEQTTMTQAVAEGFKAVYNGIITPLDAGIDKLTSKMGIFGSFASSILKGFVRQLLNIGFKQILDILTPSQAATGTEEAGINSGATATGGDLWGNLRAALGIGGGSGSGVAQTRQMIVSAQQVIVNGGLGGGGLASAFGGGGSGGAAGSGGGGGGVLNYLVNFLTSGRGTPAQRQQAAAQLAAGGGGLTSLAGGGQGVLTAPGPAPLNAAGLSFVQQALRPSGAGNALQQSFLNPAAIARLAGSGGGDLSFPQAASTGAASSIAHEGIHAGVGTATSAAARGGGFLSGIGSAAPTLGLSLGASLGGSSILGQILGGAGGLALGGIAAAAFAPALLTSVFGGAIAGVGGATASTGLGGALGGLLTGASAAFIVAPIAIALLVGAFLLGRNRARRQAEQQRAAILGDSKAQLTSLLQAVKSDRVDGADALTQAAQIRANYLSQVAQIKDSKTRRIAEATVRELDVIIAQIKVAAEEQQIRKDYVESFVPTYAMGGVQEGVGGQRIGTNNLVDVTGFGLLPGAYRGRDTFVAALAEGETILSPRDVSALGGHSRMRQVGVRGYTSGGVAGSVAPTARVAPQSAGGSGPAPVVIVVFSEADAIKLGRMMPHAIIAGKVSENIDETGGAGLPAQIDHALRGSY